MYSIKNGFDNIFDVMAYTVNAMKQSGFSADSINDYIEDAISGSDWNLLEVTESQLDECNNKSLYNMNNNKDWRDSYYSKYYNDESDSNYYYWDTENGEMLNDDSEAYEGFDSCSNHYWDCSVDILDPDFRLSYSS